MHLTNLIIRNYILSVLIASLGLFTYGWLSMPDGNGQARLLIIVGTLYFSILFFLLNAPVFLILAGRSNSVKLKLAYICLLAPLLLALTFILVTHEGSTDSNILLAGLLTNLAFNVITILLIKKELRK